MLNRGGSDERSEIRKRGAIATRQFFGSAGKKISKGHVQAATKGDFGSQHPIHSIGYKAEIVVRFSDGGCESTACDCQIVDTRSP